jgi:hypothetical protein
VCTCPSGFSGSTCSSKCDLKCLNGR